jgi:hypothetical protein
MLKTSSNIGRDKSFVDDLNKERGIVRMRVAFVPRSAEIQPHVLEICYLTLSNHIICLCKKTNSITPSNLLIGI